MPKAAFQALNLSIKHCRPFPSDLKTDQEVLKASETVIGDFWNFKNTHSSPSSSSSCFTCLELTESRYQHYIHMACFKNIATKVCVVRIKICALLSDCEIQNKGHTTRCH